MSITDANSPLDAGTNAVTVDLAEVDADRPSTVIVETILALTEKDVTELDPLAETVDPDALDRLFDYDDVLTDESTVELVVDEFQIRVRADGLIRIERRT